MTRREAIGALGALTVGASFDALGKRAAQGDPAPPLAPGAPTSPERMALIESFRRRSAGLDARFEARRHKGSREGDWTMPYRLFRSEAGGRLPLVVYLHGSGGLGTDNLKQLGLGNVFGTRVWALPDNQKRFPCHVVVPQTDRGWMRYGPPSPGDSVATLVPGLGEGARLAFELLDRLVRELPVDERRLYVAGQSMGGGGAWHMTAQRPGFFAAAVICCGSASADDPADSARTPIWNFHGDADTTVPPAVSRTRLAALRRAGAHPLSTEYAGVGHGVWEWAFTEPALLPWVFSRTRAG